MSKTGLAVLFVVIYVVSITIGLMAEHKVEVAMGAQHQSDAFDSYMVIVPEFLHQHKPYTDDAFPLPPFAMLFVAPFTWLSRPVAQAAWVFCKPAFVALILLLTLSMVRRAGVTVHRTALILIAVAWFFPVMGDIQEGQMNLLMLLPLTLALWCAQGDTHRDKILAGLLLAMAICIKVTPLAFLPYFLLRIQWRIVGWTLAGLLLWLIVVPSIFLGWSQNLTWLSQWSDIMIGPYVFHGAVKFSNGESIPEFLSRFLSHSPAWLSTDTFGNGTPHYVNILNLSDSEVHWVSRGTLCAIGILGLWWARRPLGDLKCRGYLMQIACVGVFMLWASERTWVHHYVTLIFALMATGMIASDRQASPTSRRWAWWALLAASAVMPWTSDLARLLGHDGRRYIECADFVLLASFMLVAAITTANYTGRDRNEADTDHPAPHGWHPTGGSLSGCAGIPDLAVIPAT